MMEDMQTELMIFQEAGQPVEVRLDARRDTGWLRQEQTGQRGKAQQGTRFRQWATRVLREHLTQGYTLNRQRLETNARELEAALLLVRKAAQSPELLAATGRGLG